jgi:hypothetical protein
VGVWFAVKNIFPSSPSPQTIIAGKTFEPSLVRYFGSAIEPVGEQSELVGGYFAGANSIEQMIQ